MIIYKDAFTDDEIISDVYNLKPITGLGDGEPVLFEADCSMITIGAVNVDTGANASAEEAEEGLEDSARKVIDIIESFNLQQVHYDKSMFKIRLQTYVKKLKTHLASQGKTDEQVKNVTSQLTKFVTPVLKKPEDWDFYIGEKDDSDPENKEGGQVVLLNYREDGVTPYVVILMPGLTEMKV